MNKYETIFLIKDDITEEQRNEVVSEGIRRRKFR